MARVDDAMAPGADVLTRERPLGSIRNSALLVVDVQYYVAAPGYGAHREIDPDAIPETLRYYFDRIENTMLPNIKRIQEQCRQVGMEVLFTNVENLTQDGRDRSLDYKITGFNVPKGSKEGKTLEQIAPQGDEIVITKTSSSVFNSTNIDYVLRNLEIDYLVVVGMLTDQCVESSVRDACDLGYLVTVVEDACTTYTKERHDNALEMYKGYCRRVTTDQLIAEIGGIAG